MRKSIDNVIAVRFILVIFLAQALVVPLSLHEFSFASVEHKDIASHAEDTYLWGSASGEVYVYSSTAHGDIDGDGINDLVMAHDKGDGSYRGRVYLFFGRNDMRLDVDLGSGADLTIIGKIISQNGVSLACGDVNGDGKDDIIMGANYDSPGGQSLAGSVNIIFGRDRSAFPPSKMWDLNVTPPDAIASGGIGGELGGFSVASGDLNHDGIDDIVYGAPTGNSGIHYFNGSVWTTQNGGGWDTLNSVCILNSSLGWAVGNYYKQYTTIYRYNGANWSVVDTGFSNRNVDLFGVAGYDPNNFWAVGSDGTIIKWSGSSWAQQGVGVTTTTLRGVDALDATHVWAVGDGGVILFSSDGGSSWVRQGEGVTTANLRGVDALDATHVWAVGDGGKILRYSTTWSIETSRSTNDLMGVSAADASHIWAVGKKGTLRFSDGNQWYVREEKCTNNLNGIDSLSSSQVWQVGDAYTGRVYVSMGRTSGWPPPGSVLAPDVTVNGIDTFDCAGKPVAVGDFNQDGSADLAIGAYMSNGPEGSRIAAGEAYIVYGGTTFPARPIINLQDADVTIYGATPGDMLPWYIQSPARDLNGDGIDDLILCNRFGDGPGDVYNNCGEVDVIYGGGLPPVIDLATQAPDIMFHGGASNENFGYGVALLDFSGDQLMDVAISSVELGWQPAGQPPRQYNGVICLFNGRSAWPSQVNIDNDADMVIYGAENEDQAGLFLSGANIHNNDPTDCEDLVISSRGNGPDNSRPACGEHYVFLGYDNVLPTVDIVSPADGQILQGEIMVQVYAYDYFGIQRVEIYLDGELKETLESEPYVWQWDTLDPESPGEDGRDYQIMARAVDNHGRENSATSTIKLNNTLPTPSKSWYLAEGYTGSGFAEYICVQNPCLEPTEVVITFMKNNGETVTIEPHPVLPASSRSTFLVNSYVPDAEVSTKVESLVQPVIVERAMYWGGLSEGHDTVGVTRPAKTWYLAEGSTQAGFEEWVTIQNPNDTATTVNVSFMKTDGTVIPIDPPPVLLPNSRSTFFVAAYVGAADVSTRVDSLDQPVVVERSMYRYGKAIGHNGMGTPSLSKKWYLAEGCTGSGFQEWVTIQNPNDAPASVAVEFMKPGGVVIPYGVIVQPKSRYTIYANAVPGCANSDLSTYLSSNLPIVAERAMYWNGAGKPAGHVSLGTPCPASKWYLAEGYTGSGFQEWVTIQNPNDALVEAKITFLKKDGTTVTIYPHPVLSAKSRTTFFVATYVGVAEVSTKVEAGLPIIVERPMYWNGNNGGHCSIGAWGQ